MIHSAYKVWHTRPAGGPADPHSPAELIWASGLGELDAGLRVGSKAAEEVLREAEYILNFLTDQGENDILDVFFRAGTAPTFFLRLYNNSPADTDTLGTLTSEVSGTGYAPTTQGAITRDATASGWPTLALDSGDARAVSKTCAFVAGGTWTAANRIVLASVATGTSGRFYATAALSTSRTLTNGDTLNTSMAVKLA